MKPLRIPTAAEALPGRSERMRVPDTHFVNRHRLEPPFPDGLRTAMFGMGCFWGAEKKFWQLPGVYTTAVGYAGRPHAEPDVPRSVHGHDRPQRGRARRVRSREGSLRGTAEGVLGEPRSDAGDAPGQRRRHAVPLGHLLLRRRAAARRRGVAERVPAAADEGRLRADHDRDPAGAGVLLRRGLPPAVPREESGRLLRPRRHRRQLPGRRRRDDSPSTQRPASSGRVSACSTRFRSIRSSTRLPGTCGNRVRSSSRPSPAPARRRACRRRCCADGPVILLQPRRVAARAIAQRIADERGWTHRRAKSAGRSGSSAASARGRSCWSPPKAC